MSARIDRLRDAIQVTEHCKATHYASVPVREMFGGKVAWEGIVEAFDLTGHPKTKRAYAWSYQGETDEQFVIVLEIPPVDSPNTAVRVSIAARAR